MRSALMGIKKFQRVVWGYYKTHGRKLPWRETCDPYKIFVSEVMLQQTQVVRVIPFYEKFVREFPDFWSLARVGTTEVLRAWRGLGYNRRALYLKRVAEIVVEKFSGALPKNAAELEALPGVGKATAAAILAYAWGRRVVFIETNIRTVFIHFFFHNRKRVSDDAIEKLVAETLPTENFREWYYALMDYGAMLKLSMKNFSRQSVTYKKQSPFRGSRREARGKVLRFLEVERRASAPALAHFLGKKSAETREILSALSVEGFVVCRGKTFSLVS